MFDRLFNVIESEKLNKFIEIILGLAFWYALFFGVYSSLI